MTQTRFDFPDYSAKEQERDIERSNERKKTNVYMTKVNDVWNAIVVRERNHIITAKQGEDLTAFSEYLKEYLPRLGVKPRFRYFNNNGVDHYLKQNQTLIRRINNGRD